MAEIAAIGLAGNIVQFVDFAVKLFREGREVYRSAEGASNEVIELGSVTQSLRLLAQKLHQRDSGTVNDKGGLQNVAQGCEKLATDLVDRLEELKVKHTENRAWGSFKLALAFVTSKTKIGEYERRLDRFRKALDQEILVDIRFVQPCSGKA